VAIQSGKCLRDKKKAHIASANCHTMEGSRISIVRDPSWRPIFGPDNNTFRMTDLMLFAFEGKTDLLNPLCD
jgi:hypothetical protein